MVFQLDNLGMILPDWERRWMTTSWDAPNYAWNTSWDSLLMLRVLRVLGSPLVLPGRALYTTAFQRAFRLKIPRYFEIVEMHPQLPPVREIEAAWAQRGAQFR